MSDSLEKELEGSYSAAEGGESIGMKLIAQLDELREETRHSRKRALRWALTAHKLNHENDALRARVSYWREQAINPPAIRPLTDRSPLMLTDRGEASEGYGLGGQESAGEEESALTVSEDGWTRRQLQDALRLAGWKRTAGPTAAYVSPDDPEVVINLDEYRRPIGVLWRYFAVRRELPATTRKEGERYG